MLRDPLGDQRQPGGGEPPRLGALSSLHSAVDRVKVGGRFLNSHEISSPQFLDASCLVAPKRPVRQFMMAYATADLLLLSRGSWRDTFPADWLVSAFIDLLEQGRADEANDGIVIGEDADAPRCAA